MNNRWCYVKSPVRIRWILGIPEDGLFEVVSQCHGRGGGYNEAEFELGAAPTV